MSTVSDQLTRRVPRPENRARPIQAAAAQRWADFCCVAGSFEEEAR